MKNAGNGVARAATVIIIISVLGKLIGFVREQVIASQFGATGLTDAYVAAWSVPQMLGGLIGGAISLAFVPVFLRYLGRGEEHDGSTLLSVALRWLILLLALAATAAFLCAPKIVSLIVPNFSADQMHLTVALLRITLTGGVFSGLSVFFAAVLNARKHFGWPTFGPVLMSIGAIIVTLLSAQSLGIVGLGWAMVFGTGLQLVFLLWQLFRANVKVVELGVGWHHLGLRQVLSLAGPIVVGTLFGQLYQFVDKGIASGLDAGSIAALNYAFKLTQLPVGIFVTSLATAIYPTLAEYAGRGNEAGLSSATGSGIRLLSLVMVPAAVGLVVLRIPVVRLAFERGSFDHEATVQTATALAFYAIGLLGVSNVQVLSRAFYSLQDSMTPVKVNIGAALVNVVLAMILVKPLGHGGLALAYSLAMLLNMTCLIWLLSKKTGQAPDFLPSLAKITGAATAMGLVVHFLYPRVAGLGQVIALGLSVGVGALVYLGLVAVLGVEELSQLMATLKRRLGRDRGEAPEVAAD